MLVSLPGCRGAGAPAPGIEPEVTTSIAVTRGSIKRRADRDAIGAPFWLAVARLDPTSAEVGATTTEERLFAGAFRALIEGRDDEALILFAALVHSSDVTVRAASRTGQTLILQAEGRWRDIAALEEPGDVVEPVDRASIFLWARAFAALRPVTVHTPGTSVQIPLRLSTVGTPVVSVRINGSDRYFWLDTGASLSIISADVARELGVAAVSTDTLAVATWGGRVAARPGVVGRLELGPMELRDVPIAILEDSALTFQRAPKPGDFSTTLRLDGVLGVDVLRHVAVTLDVKGGELTIARPPRRNDDSRARRNLFWLGFPVARLTAGSGRPALLGVDTGADSTMIGESWFLVDSSSQLRSRRGQLVGLGATAVNTIQDVREIRLSDGAYTVRLRNVAVAPERRSTFITMDGVLGGDFIRSAVVHMDFANGEFSIRPGHRPPPRDAVTVTSH